MRVVRFSFGLVLLIFLANSNPRGSDFRLDLARRFASEGQYRSAVEEYKKFLGENPQSPEVYVELAEIRVKQGKYYLAIFNLKTALKQNPDHIEARETLAKTYEKSGKTEDAIIEWRKLATLSDNDLTVKRAEKHIADLMNKVKNGEVTSSNQDGLSPNKPVKKKIRQKIRQEEKNESDDFFDSEDLTSESSQKTKTKTKKATKVSPQRVKSVSPPTKDKPGIYTQTNFKRAVALINSKKYDAGLKEIRRCLAKVPGHPGAYYYGGIARYQKEDYKKAIINFNKGLTYPEFGINGHFYLGKIYRRLGRKNLAVHHLTKFKKLTHGGSRRKEAIKILTQLKEGASESSPQNKLGGAKKFTAKRDIRVKLDIRPIGQNLHLLVPVSDSKHSELLNQSVAFYSEKKPEHAINALKEIILNQSGSIYSRLASLNLAVVYLRLGLFKNAKNYSEAFLEGTRSSAAKAYGEYIHARALLGEKRPEQALNELSSIKPHNRLGPSSKDIHGSIAEAYQLQGNFQKAVSFLKKMQNRTSDKNERLRLSLKLASLYQKKGEQKQSIQQLTNVINNCSSKKYGMLCADARVQLGDLNYQLNRWKQALRHYRQAVSRFPEHKLAPWCLYQIGNIHKRRGELKMAMDNYRDVIEQFPESYWASQARWKKDDAVWQNEYKEIFD